MPPARRVARRLLRTVTVAALATVLLAAPAAGGPADPGGARVGLWAARAARPDGAPPGPGAPAGPAAPAAGRTARSVPRGDLGALRAEATRLRTRLDAQNRRLEVLAEELEEAYARGVELLADASRLDARRRAAVRGLAVAQTALNQRAGGASIAGPGYYVSGFIGAGDPADTLARVPLQRAILDDDLKRLAHDRAVRPDRPQGSRGPGHAQASLALVDRVERAKAELDDTRAKLSARLVEQAQAAAGLDAKRVEAERLADQIGGELRTMDRRLRALIEQRRRREEARQRASFASFMDAARARGLATMQDGRASAAALRAVRVALAQLGAPYRWGAEGPGEFDCSGLTSFAYARAGVTIPRVSRAQFAAYASIRPVDRMRLVVGDLVFFADNPRDPSTIHHVGMYIGRGLMVEAPYTGAVVRTSSIWRSSYAGAVRPAP